MRVRFDEQLKKLHLELITLGAYCEEAISASIKALLEEDDELVHKVEEKDELIQDKEREIEGLCMKLLLQQQPVARDLRTISSALKIIYDMERIGDQASDIAGMNRFLKNSVLKNQIQLKEMAEAVIQMVSNSVESFVKKDDELAKKVIATDDQVDELFNAIKSQLIDLIVKGTQEGEACMDLMITAKHLERTGDHAVNIAQWVIYADTGVRWEEGEKA
jgi:phosphate transport system protein